MATHLYSHDKKTPCMIACCSDVLPSDFKNREAKNEAMATKAKKLSRRKTS